MYKAVDLSKYIVIKCAVDDYPITNLHLQKILYYIQKDFLQKDKLAFFEDVEAWQFGPVVPVVDLDQCLLQTLLKSKELILLMSKPLIV